MGASSSDGTNLVFQKHPSPSIRAYRTTAARTEASGLRRTAGPIDLIGMDFAPFSELVVADFKLLHDQVGQMDVFK